VIFLPTAIPGAFIVEPERREDQRGFFARTWCAREFEARGLNPRLSQCSVSFNKRKGTLRGMHYQVAPHEEAKVVRCTMGAIHDVVVDLRPTSAAYMRHVVVVLTAENRRMLYVPEGCAHGFQTLVDGTEIFYQISEFHSPEHARGVRWNDPAFAIAWPPDDRVISERDRSYPDFTGPRGVRA
jgi:dTDP-4-dehydrorhamnose 3,5-epimerase